MKTFKTEQEAFWAGEFGDEYIKRNDDIMLLASKTSMFAKMLQRAYGVKSIIEFGSNVGLNLKALHTLFPDTELSAIEISKTAAKMLSECGFTKVYNESLLEFEKDYERDLTFTSGVLIHIDPNSLQQAYSNLYNTSKKYILLCEYYSTNPVEIPYRGHLGKLFKRDFAGEFMEKFSDVELVDYGFFYRGDSNHWQEDMNWFLMKKGK